MAAASGPAQAARVKVAKKDGTAVAVDRHRQHQPRRDAERLQRAENQLRHVTKGFDAVSVLLQYLVDDVSTTRRDTAPTHPTVRTSRACFCNACVGNTEESVELSQSTVNGWKKKNNEITVFKGMGAKPPRIVD